MPQTAYNSTGGSRSVKYSFLEGLTFKQAGKVNRNQATKENE